MAAPEHEPKPSVEGAERLAATTDIEAIEAPVTWKAYLMCAFAALGGIFYGYDTGYISNIDAMAVSEARIFRPSFVPPPFFLSYVPIDTQGRSGLM